jgi:hypothetical protein
VKRGAAATRIRARRAKRAARRAARRAAVRDELRDLPRAPSLSEYAAAASGASEHVFIDERGNVTTVEVDPKRFAAALARYRSEEDELARAGGDDDDDDDDRDEDDDADDDLVDIPASPGGGPGRYVGYGVGELDDDCPICRAIRASAIGAPRRGWSLD